MDTKSIVEATSESVVREYLSRKGLKGTLKKMDDECPRNESSISNRQSLMKQLNIEKLMKKNKENPDPLKTMLEIMTRYFVEKRPQPSTSDAPLNGADSLGSSMSFTPQTNQPVEASLSNKSRYSAPAKKEWSSTSLIIDEDVQGECLPGEGRSGLFEASHESPAAAAKPAPNRPLSSRHRTGAITSNDDNLGNKRRPMMKPKAMPQPSRMSMQQMDQHRRLSSESTEKDSSWSSNNPPESMFSRKEHSSSSRTNTSPSLYNSDDSRTTSQPEKPPDSFEALLMKGQEKSQKIGLEKKSPDNVHPSYKVETSSMSEERLHSKPKPKKSQPPSATQMMDLEVGDLDDLDLDAELSSVQLQRSKPLVPLTGPAKLTKMHSNPIDLKTAVTLKTLVLGSPSMQYTDEWRLQAFTFSDLPDLKYGIVQKRGGPCGVLAAVQACVMQEMLFGGSHVLQHYKEVSRPERSKILALALSDIFWRAGGEARAQVALPGDTSNIISSNKFRQDTITEKLQLYTFTSYEELSSFMIQSISQFETDGLPGVILVMYSAILSRKPYQVRYDFDVQDTTMIASHGYCTQELVNLITTGRAAANTFNDVIQLGEGAEVVTLKGVHTRADIGLLSLFEHYKSCEVGTFLKTPKFPIWLVCSESHFSVLFSTRRDLVNDWKAERRFDLYYWDGLSRQQEEVKLTLCTMDQTYKPSYSEDDLVPPLEHCIHTKWKDAEIDWNGSEPIL